MATAGRRFAPAWSVNGQLTSKRSPGLTFVIGIIQGDLKPGQVEGGKTVPPILIGLSKNAFQLGGLQGRVTGMPSQFFRSEEFDLFARRQFAVRINDSENVSFSYNCYAHGVMLVRILRNKQTEDMQLEDGGRRTEDGGQSIKGSVNEIVMFLPWPILRSAYLRSAYGNGKQDDRPCFI